jgi:hypothetical protein
MIGLIMVPIFFAWLNMERMNFHHKEYYFSKKVVGLALLLCYSNKT